MTQFKERRYQTRAKESFDAWLKTNNKLATIILPTGVGKTATAALCLNEVRGKKVLWVAHREELIDQANAALNAIIPGHHIEIEMAERKANPDSAIVVGSVQTIARNRKHLQNFIPDIIVIDEYHHYSESNVQYDGLLQRFPNARVLGLTATPWRFSGDNLPLGDILIKMDIGTAVERGYLVTPIPEVLATNVSLADVKTRMGDFDLKGLSKAVNVDSRNQQIAKRIIELVRDAKRQGILFGVDVEHSKAMFDILKKEVRAAEVYGETPTEERRTLMSKIRNGEIDVLCNNLVATEGFDVPHLSFVAIGRPTKSLGLYMQMTGRGLRTSQGKNDCIVLDVFDKIKAKQSRASFKDMAAVGDLYGEKKRATSVLSAEIAKKLVNFPIFVKPTKIDRWQTDEETFAVDAWAISEAQWLISWSAEVKTQKLRSRAIWVPFDGLPDKDVKGKSVRHNKFGEGVIKEVLEKNSDDPKILVEFGWGTDRVIQMKSLERMGYVQEHVPDQFDIQKIERLFFICLPDFIDKGRLIAFEKSGPDLLLQEDLRLTKNEIDAYLLAKATADGNWQLVRSDAKWKKQPASAKQIEYVESLVDSGRVGFDLDISSLTKGEVSSIIEQSKWQDLINRKFGTDYKTKLLGYDASVEDV